MPVTPYATFGSPQLADAVGTALADRSAVLLGNHGAVVVAASPDRALQAAQYLEYVCEVELRALATGLPVRRLPADEIGRVREPAGRLRTGGAQMTAGPPDPRPGGDPDDLRGGLVALSRALGDPAADLAILGEGNTSADLGDGSFWVKASGASLAGVGPDDFVRVDRQAVLDLVDDATVDEHDQETLGTRLGAATFSVASSVASPTPTPTPTPASQRPPSPARRSRPCCTRCRWGCPASASSAHTHPTAVNVLLCSDRAGELVAGSLFPDQVVVCGASSLLVPYAEPGLGLGRAFRDGLRGRVDRHGEAPRLVYLGNHGIVALGDSAAQVRQITAMAVKAARVLGGVLALGRPAYLDPETVSRLDTRTDERHRRDVLARSAAREAR